VEGPPRQVDENSAEVNFELVELLKEREERDWTYSGRLRHEREKKLRDPQDVLMEADRLQQQLKKRHAQGRVHTAITLFDETIGYWLANNSLVGRGPAREPAIRRVGQK
jgi:hypothetical protein